jgi:hypothetical protein
MLDVSCCPHRCDDKGYQAVWQHYTANWQGCARAWAVHGRQALWALGINTNNHLERWFGLFKNTILQRKRLPRLVLLMGVLLQEVMVPAINDRLMKLSQLERSGTAYLRGPCDA